MNPLNASPIAIIEVTTKLPAYATVGVQFLGDRSYDPDGGPLTYQWDWGDGTPSTAGPSAIHIFMEPGNYQVSLAVEDTDNATATTSLDILIIPLPLLTLVPYRSMGFWLDVPQDWMLRENVGPGAVLRLYGPPLIYPAAIAVDTGIDLSIRETQNTLDSFVDDAVRKLEGANPPGYLDGPPAYRLIANHSGISFVIRYPFSNLIMKTVYVVSEANGRWWRLALTSQISNFAVEEGNFVVLNATFEQMLASFQTTAAVIERVSPLSYEVLVPMGSVLVMASSMGALSTLVLHPRRRNSSSIQRFPPR